MRFGQLASFVSSFCNPMIYLATNENFRIFTKLSMKRVISSGTSFCGKGGGGRGTKEKIKTMMSSIQRIFGPLRNRKTEGRVIEVTVVDLEKYEQTDYLQLLRIVGCLSMICKSKRENFSTTCSGGRKMDEYSLEHLQ